MATNTYVPIETYTIGSDTATITFGAGNTLPQGYTDLVIVINTTANYVDNGARGYIQFNGDTNNNYADVWFGGDGSSPSTNKDTPQSSIAYGVVGNATSPFTTQIINVNNYANNNTVKTTLSRSSNPNTAGNYGLRLTFGYWNNTAPITTIALKCDGSYRAGSTFTLYGIANAQIGAPKATGGIITEDSTYYYHTFGASGTFTPQQNLTNVDYLVIAGGGSGASNDGNWDEGEGGGGAGGLRSTVDVTGGGGTLESKISLTSGTAYTITVGAGGAANTGNATGVNGTNSSIAGSGLTTITSVGGGGGANYGASANNGGSGGGAGGWSATNNGSGTANQGYAGGNNTGSGRGGGGGGAGSVGATGITTGNGGAGVAIPSISNITGTGVATYYAGGGGGGGRRYSETSAGAGGSGGGGTGGTGAASGTAGAGGNGVTNTGSGGGGGGATGPNAGKGGNGGSGVVVIRYAKA